MLTSLQLRRHKKIWRVSPIQLCRSSTAVKEVHQVVVPPQEDSQELAVTDQEPRLTMAHQSRRSIRRCSMTESCKGNRRSSVACAHVFNRSMTLSSRPSSRSSV